MAQVKTYVDILTKTQLEICFALRDAFLIKTFVIEPNYSYICQKAGQDIPPMEIAKTIASALDKAQELCTHFTKH